MLFLSVEEEFSPVFSILKSFLDCSFNQQLKVQQMGRGAGLSLSFEAGVTLKISHITCKYIGSLRKFFKLVPRKCIFQPSEVHSIKK